MKSLRIGALLVLVGAVGFVAQKELSAQQAKKAPAKAPAAKAAPQPVAKTAAKPADKVDAKPADKAKSDEPEVSNRWWNQWAGSSTRNNTPVGKNIPAEFEPGDFDAKTGEWKKETSKNIKWVAKLGSQSYGNPVVADGKIWVGTNNGAGWLKRYPAETDLGCLLCFNEADGKFLWQHSSEKLPTGRVHDWPLQGICCAPYVEGKRLWFVTSRGEVLCLDTEGFLDGKNNGPFTSETNAEKDEADVIWSLNMMTQLGVSQHNMCSCSITATGDILWVCTSNGVDESHVNLPAPQAPSFLAVDKNTGKVLWADSSPGMNILHGQWSSPTYAVLGGVPQVMFAGGDGYLYSFKGEVTPGGKAEMLWKFDANPKESKYILGGRGTRNEIIATPVVYKDKVYLAVGQDPEHGEGPGHLWCIDPTKRGDVSSELAFNVKDLSKPIPHKRLQAVDATQGEVARPNPNSAVVWHYADFDQNGNGKTEFEETMHRTCGSVVIKDDLLYLSDFSGLFHCLNAIDGKPYWTHDLFAATWGSALIVDGKVFIGDEEGKVTVFKLQPEKEILAENNMGNSVYSTPVVANDILYIANKTHLFAIENLEDKDK
jgi:outer membrane protein assembly factor BamB